MTSGGARYRSGKAADPQAIRRENDHMQWRDLPAEGRQGDPPSWPLARPAKRELEVWAEEWRRPQAIIWEENRQEREVALYVRTLVDAEQRGAPGNVRTLARQYMDALGISGAGLRLNRWRIVPATEQAPSKSQVTTNDPDRAATKAKLRSIAGGAARSA